MATILEPPMTETASRAPAHGLRPHRLTIERYCQMIAKGIFHENEPLFLWEGQIVEKMIKGPTHSAILTDLYHRFVRLVPAGWFVVQEQPITLIDASIPEPGITIVRSVPHDYLKRPPSA